MARPAGRPRAVREASVYDLREEFLARCRAKNLSDRTIEWHEDRTHQLSDLRAGHGTALARELSLDDVDKRPRRSASARSQTADGSGLRSGDQDPLPLRAPEGLLADDIARDLEMPKVPQVIIETFSDGQSAHPRSHRPRGSRHPHCRVRCGCRAHP
jgi:hypothetical protein